MGDRGGIAGPKEEAREEATTKFQPDIETLPRGALAELQMTRLAAVLAHARERVDMYRERFDAAGLPPGFAPTPDDLGRIPFTRKSDLRDHYPFGLLAVPREDLARIHASSGTTGKPTVVGYTQRDLDIWFDLMARTLACAGARPGDMLHNAFGYGLFTGGLGTHYGAQRLGCTVVPVSGGLTERQVMLLQDFGARVLTATPSYALNIAEVAGKLGVDLAAGPLRVGFFGAEPWSEAMRTELEQAFGIRAIDNYGLSEILGPGVATECREAQDGLHGWEDHFLFEIVNPESGQPLPMGERGELVVTTLTKEALPMIRYRTGDITGMTDEPCACGRTHARIERITGRTDDMLIIRGVNLYPSQIESAVLGLARVAPHYELVVSRDGAMDSLTVRIEARPGIGSEDHAAIAAEVGHQVKARVGVGCAVEVVAPGEIPRSQGKAARVRDRRKL